MAEIYKEAMDEFAKRPTLDVWYYHVEADAVLEVLERSSKRAKKSARKMVKKARTRTQAQTLDKITEVVDGRRRIVSQPPLIVPIEDDVGDERVDLLDLLPAGGSEDPAPARRFRVTGTQPFEVSA